MGQTTLTSDPQSAVLPYPCKVLIIDVDEPDTVVLWNGMAIKTPEASKPYIGKVGIVERVADPTLIDYDTVRITMPDGHVLWGWECWWAPIVDPTTQGTDTSPRP